MISRNSGDRFVRSFDPTFEPNGAVGIRRLEVITGVGGRRSWSRDDKARIIAESFAARANVSAVARRYGLRPQQVYAWRRLPRGGALALPGGRDIPRAERKSRFATDSPLEGAGFEPSVPRESNGEKAKELVSLVERKVPEMSSTGRRLSIFTSGFSRD